MISDMEHPFTRKVSPKAQDTVDGGKDRDLLWTREELRNKQSDDLNTGPIRMIFLTNPQP